MPAPHALSTPRTPIPLVVGDLGYRVERALVPDDLVCAALRRINLEMMRTGLTPEQIQEWHRVGAFPWLRWEPEILALREPLERLVGMRPGDRWGDAQLVVRFPDDAEDWPPTGHVDVLPEWAEGLRYRAVIGVALTPSRLEDGGLFAWPASHLAPGQPPAAAPVPVELEPGDVVVMDPWLLHCCTLNRAGAIRYAVYFRLLEPAG